MGSKAMGASPAILTDCQYAEAPLQNHHKILIEGTSRTSIIALHRGGRIMADPDDKREAAIRRLKAKRGFWNHAFLYCVVNILLVVIWFVSGRSYFWPAWAMAGWGIGLAMNAWNVFFEKAISEEDIQREIQRRG
jgi:hypothetical protein